VTRCFCSAATAPVYAPAAHDFLGRRWIEKQKCAKSPAKFNSYLSGSLLSVIVLVLAMDTL
jgi:hypothetical protein